MNIYEKKDFFVFLLWTIISVVIGIIVLVKITAQEKKEIKNFYRLDKTYPVETPVWKVDQRTENKAVA